MNIEPEYKQTLNNSGVKTIDAIIAIVAGMKSRNAERLDDYEVGADDVLGELIGKLHVFQMSLKEGK